MLVSKRVITATDTVSKIESDHSTLSMATAHAEYPADKLRTDNIDDHALAYGQRQSQTAIQSYFSAALLPDSLDYVSVWGLNRPTPFVIPSLSSLLLSNQARLIVDEYGLEIHNAQVDSTNFSTTNLTGGTYATLNQILDAPEEPITGGYTPEALTAVNDSLDTQVNLQFRNIAARPLTGIQTILIHARDSVDTNEYPTITVTLRQSGVDIQTLTATEVERTRIIGIDTVTPLGRIYKYPFDASLLPSQTLPVQLRIVGETTSGRSVDFLSAVLRTNVTGTVFDSGWQELDQAGDRVAWAPRVEFVNTEVGHYVIVLFSDYGLRTLIDAGPPRVWDYTGFGESLRVGRFTAGSALDLPIIKENGFNLRKVGNNQGSLIQSYGGFLRANRSDITRWEASITINPQSQTRLFGEIEAHFQSVGNTIPAVYIITEGDNNPAELVPAFYALLVNHEATDIGLQMGFDTSDQAAWEDYRFDLRWLISEAAGKSIRRGE